jgi:hypothetical protein
MDFDEGAYAELAFTFLSVVSPGTACLAAHCRAAERRREAIASSRIGSPVRRRGGSAREAAPPIDRALRDGLPARHAVLRLRVPRADNGRSVHAVPGDRGGGEPRCPVRRRRPLSGCVSRARCRSGSPCATATGVPSQDATRPTHEHISSGCGSDSVVPEKPVDDPFVEAFNSWIGDECLH